MEELTALGHIVRKETFQQYLDHVQCFYICPYLISLWGGGMLIMTVSIGRKTENQEEE